MRDDFNIFWKSIESLLTSMPSTDTVFNQYRDVNDELDVPSAAAIRLSNLANYMLSACESASILVVGEAAGPWGCRFSGIPFVGERQLIDSSFPINGERSSRPDPHRVTKILPPYISNSATAFWNVLLPFNARFIVWDAFPLHPHEPGDVLTVRNPSKKEVSEYGEALKLIKAFVKPSQIVAVGKRAFEELEALNQPCIYVRHPSRGGKRAFSEGIRNIFG